jgi:RNA polymerase sigma-70 factor, ECF subfamily
VPQLSAEEFVVELAACQRRLNAYVFSLVGNREHTKDILQEISLVLWRRAADFKRGTSFISWALGVAHFQVLAYRKKQTREKVFFSDDLLGELSARCQENIHDDERQQALVGCLEKLPQRQRELLQIRYAESRSHEDLAKQFDKTVGSIAMSLHRTRMALIKCVEQSLSRWRTA